MGHGHTAPGVVTHAQLGPVGHREGVGFGERGVERKSDSLVFCFRRLVDHSEGGPSYSLGSDYNAFTAIEGTKIPLLFFRSKESDDGGLLVVVVLRF